ncbi:hypothetical protein QYF36_004994 [Acer negundo]|nr:hypothetical protein QYF36_004994 [Acer negundo]
MASDVASRKSSWPLNMTWGKVKASGGIMEQPHPGCRGAEAVLNLQPGSSISVAYHPLSVLMMIFSYNQIHIKPEPTRPLPHCAAANLLEPHHLAAD